MSTIYAVVGKYTNLQQAVYENRGITMSTAATRRLPNAFNLIRQAEVLARSGYGSASQQFQDTLPLRSISIDHAYIKKRFALKLNHWKRQFLRNSNYM